MDSSAVFLDIAKLAIPTAAGWWVAWLTNRRERRVHDEKQEAAQQDLLVKQGDRLTAGWAEMTTQAREIIRTMQMETVTAKAELAACLGERGRLLAELATVNAKYEAAIRDLEELSPRRKKRTPHTDSE